MTYATRFYNSYNSYKVKSRFPINKIKLTSWVNPTYRLISVHIRNPATRHYEYEYEYER
jgi:hypothetical protein